MAVPAGEFKCMLIFSSPERGERIVLRSDAPPEAEYGMFDIGDIELRASEPGRVREHGYQTVASKARTRLANAGISVAAAHDVAHAMQPILAEAYARGAAAKRIARYLMPSELFRADTYDASAHLYRGVFLNLAALSKDLELEHVGNTLQALYLASLLEHEPDDTDIIIQTDECTKGGKPGTRTYKRPTFTEMQRLMNALGGLAHKNPQPELTTSLPKADVIDFLRARQDAAPDEDARALYKSIEAQISTREMPEKGPLAQPELWDIEERIEANKFEGTLDAVDEAERKHGRTPGTTYLRARIALELRLEPPKLIAERVSALALSMTSFAELGLLAAEAWLEAGDPRRAMPYARDLIDSRGIDEGLLIRARTLLSRAESNKPKRRMSPTLVDAVRPAPLTRRPSTDSEPPTPVPTPVPRAPHEPEPMAPIRESVVPSFGRADGSAPSIAPRAEGSSPSAIPRGAPQTLDDASPPAFTHGLGIEDLVLEPETPPPAQSSRPTGRSGGPPPVPPPVPSSRSMRAAPPAPSSARMPVAKPLELPNAKRTIPAMQAQSAMPAQSAPPPQPTSPPPQPTLPPPQNEIAIPDIPSTDPMIPEERPSAFPALRAQRPAAAEVQPHSIPPPLELDLAPPAPAPADAGASFTLELPGPDAAPEAIPMSAPAPSMRRRMSGMVMETRPPSSYDPRAEPDSELIPRTPGVPEIRSAPPPVQKMRSSPAPARRSLSPAEPPPFEAPAAPAVPAADVFATQPSPLEPTPDDGWGADDGFGPPPASEPEPMGGSAADVDDPTPPRLDAPALLVPSLDDVRTSPSLPPVVESTASAPVVIAAPAPEPAPPPAPVAEPPPSRLYMRGASMPPYKLENPAPLLPKAPLLPRITGDELAEHLALPPGVSGDARATDTLPTSVLEARIQFTLLSRELGLDYRLKRGIELRADETGIEAMQAVLVDMFPDRVVRTSADAYEVRRHGAFLSEILSRRLDAEWMDISPPELGHWVMIVPPNTRIWPFGRVSRLISMGHKERDLVSYFFELTARGRAR